VGAMKTAMSEEFLQKAASAAYPYGDGHAAERIVGALHEWLDDGRIDLKKEFYDIEVNE